MAFWIADWQRYEPDPHSGGTVAPLKWVRIEVHGHSQGPGWRRLQRRARDDMAATFGLFIKLLEIAADERREHRNGLIRVERGGQPATLEDIAFDLDFDLDAVRRWMAFLVERGWILDMPDGQKPLPHDPQRPDESATSGDAGKSRGIPGTPGNAYGDEDETETGDRDADEHEDETETKRLRDSTTKTDGGVNGSVGDLIRETVREVCVVFRRTGGSDVETINRMVNHYLHSHPETAAETAARLLGLAREKKGSVTLRNPLGAWITECKEKFGTWPGRGRGRGGRR